VQDLNERFKKLMLVSAAGVLLAVIGLSFGIVGMCVEQPADIQREIDELSRQREELQQAEIEDEKALASMKAQLTKLERRRTSVHDQMTKLQQEVRILEAQKEGRKVTYLLKLELRQEHITFDLDKHIKDAMNAVTFSIAVDKDFYDDVSVGDALLEKFRSGSAWVEGSFGNWKITVKGKQRKVR